VIQRQATAFWPGKKNITAFVRVSFTSRRAAEEADTNSDVHRICWCWDGWGRDPRKQKDFCTTKQHKKKSNAVTKRRKQKISWELDVGVCYSITATRFLCYISFSSFWSAYGNGNLFGTNRTKKWVRNCKSEGRMDVFPNPPPASLGAARIENFPT